MRYKKIVSLLKSNISHYDFKKFIFNEKNIEWIMKVTYEDIIKIFYEIKTNTDGLYIFIPFCYIYLGINLFVIYESMYDEDSKEYLICEDIYSSFSFYNVKLHYKQEKKLYLQEFNKEFSLEDLNIIRKKLVEQGATPVQFLEVMVTDEKIFFNLPN